MEAIFIASGALPRTIPTMMAFSEHYQRPDLEDVRAQAQGFARACTAAASADELVGTVRAWSELRAAVDTHYNIAMVRFSQDTRDPAARAEQAFWDQAAPLMRELDVLHARTLLESRFAGELDAALGPQLCALKQCEVATFVPEIREAVAEEAALVSQYTQLLARPEVELAGERMSLSALYKYLEHPDRDTRLAAHKAQDIFLGQNSAALNDIFHRLVILRDHMGTALGHTGYVPLAYQLRSRLGYGPAEVAEFRRIIMAEIVPLAAQLRARQARELGVDTLLYHDEPVWLRAGNPPLVHDSGDMVLRAAQHLYHQLHPEVGNFFDMMLERGLIDVEVRDGKAGGGFCTSFAELGVPFIFGNFTGSSSDVVTLTHECGHAFQAYASRHLEPRVEYTFPTYEAAEVHSMSMELLTFPWMELFFGDAADDYRRTHLERLICLLAYTVLVDHFQHEAYENPRWSPAERNQRWLELERMYMPERDYGGLYPYLATGTVWQRQRHIYIAPFYYIDYGLAQICALQLWQRAQHDRERAMADFLAISRVGGSLSFLDMLALGNLRSPFDPECVREVVRRTAAAVA